jgi:predicted protein tyrosine phosphatase
LKNTNFFSKRMAEMVNDPDGRASRVLISITTPAIPDSITRFCAPAVLHDESWKDVLRLQFDDVDPGHMNPGQTRYYRLFNNDDAIAILKFLKKHQDDTVDALVHCEAGISRSAAVSKFIAHIYNLSFPEQYSIYNKHVFSTLLRVHGESLYGDGLMTAEDLPGLKENHND